MLFVAFLAGKEREMSIEFFMGKPQRDGEYVCYMQDRTRPNGCGQSSCIGSKASGTIRNRSTNSTAEFSDGQARCRSAGWTIRTRHASQEYSL
jgi:hypothetical protein